VPVPASSSTPPPTPISQPSTSTSSKHHHTSAPPTPPATTPPPSTNDVPAPASAVSCPSGGSTVSSTDELSAALTSAQPGTTIHLADGTYTGNFVTTVSGTSTQPIWLCGDSGAILDGGEIKSGYVLHLNGASHWRLVGFTVRDGQKGVVADNSTGSIIQSLTVTQIGDEGIHLRSASTNDVVLDNTVSHTGLHSKNFGEGIYVGSAHSNWSTYSGGQPDRSDHNVIQGNHVSATAAESLDIKEGTTAGLVIGNEFDGTGGLTGADSWVDVKGNGWLIRDNTGTHSPEDGFQTHSVVDGWGTDNTFENNVANVDGPGYGIHLAPVDDNVVACSNKAVGAAKGLTNISCSSS
jgi:hypothetical protein